MIRFYHISRVQLKEYIREHITICPAVVLQPLADTSINHIPLDYELKQYFQ